MVMWLVESFIKRVRRVGLFQLFFTTKFGRDTPDTAETVCAEKLYR
jgi:hypothetical protein